MSALSSPGRELVVFSLLGPSLDAGKGPRRWERWRPTVALCQHEDLIIHRLELLYQDSFAELAQIVTADLKQVSPETRVNPTRLAQPDPWDFEQVYGALHDLARGYPFQPEREDYLVHITTGTHVAQICLFLLTESRYFPARLLQTAPPKRDRGAGPGELTIIDLDLSRYDRLASRFRAEQREALSTLKSGIDTKNEAFNAMMERVEKVALASRAPMLLTGPTGAGKSLLARKVYDLKRARRQLTGPFVDVNCATLRGDAAMSTLFGHVKGAFTGALVDRPGLLRKASLGVLFLDEVGELGLDEQAMLLRALEEKAFYPVGSDREVKSDFQLLAGTNRDLAERVAQGRFREDLLARIDVWTFRMPGLRERLEDLEPNLRYELERAAETLKVRVTLSAEARERFLAFGTSPEARWAGNFRDLSAAVLRMATLAPGGRIGAALVREEIERLRASWGRGAGAPAGGRDAVAGVMGEERAASLDRFDRVQLADVLGVCQASRSLADAGRVLFARSRGEKATPNDSDRIRKYLLKFGLHWKDIHPDDSQPEGASEAPRSSPP